MRKQTIVILPFSSSTMVRDPRLCVDIADLLMSMEYDKDGDIRSMCLRFVKQRASRKRAEIYCTVWHMEGACDQVCEVLDSDWVAELRSAAPSGWREYWTMRHFMINVDSFGCLEVIAESVSLSDTTDGINR